MASIPIPGVASQLVYQPHEKNVRYILIFANSYEIPLDIIRSY